jgi:hypothetical protein
MDEGGSVTLIFYKLNPKWWKEPALNLIAATATMSSFTHAEIAIGSDAGTHGQMTNVCRVFNDEIGTRYCSDTAFVAYLGQYIDVPTHTHIVGRCGVDGTHRQKSTVSCACIITHRLEPVCARRVLIQLLGAGIVTCS